MMMETIMNKSIRNTLFAAPILLAPVTSVFAAEASQVVTAQDNIVINTTAQVTLNMAPLTTLLASNYTKDTRLATWSAETTAGALAIRLNPTIMKSTATAPAWGYATSTTNSANTIRVSMVTANNASCGFTQANATLISGWWVCNQGIGQSNGYLSLGQDQTIAVGNYPMSIDAAVWQY